MQQNKQTFTGSGFTVQPATNPADSDYLSFSELASYRIED